jgi:hypothetical protein
VIRARGLQHVARSHFDRLHSGGYDDSVLRYALFITELTLDAHYVVSRKCHGAGAAYIGSMSDHSTMTCSFRGKPMQLVRTIPAVGPAPTRAVDECVITRLEKATMIATIHDEPEFSELFMSYLLTRNSRIEEDLID